MGPICGIPSALAVCVRLMAGCWLVMLVVAALKASKKEGREGKKKKKNRKKRKKGNRFVSQCTPPPLLPLSQCQSPLYLPTPTSSPSSSHVCVCVRYDCDWPELYCLPVLDHLDCLLRQAFGPGKGDGGRGGEGREGKGRGRGRGESWGSIFSW